MPLSKPTKPADVAPGTFPDRADRTGYGAAAQAWAEHEVDVVVPGVNEHSQYHSDVADYVEQEADAAEAAASASSGSASTATTQAAAAAESAASALNAPGTTATSTTSTAVGDGSKTITIQTGKSLAVGQRIICARTADPVATYMVGQISAYNSGTGSLSFTVNVFSGNGTYTDWTVSLAAFAAPIGSGGASASGSVTLTAGSAQVQKITTTGYGQSVTKPDATTCVKGVPLFGVMNAGPYDLAVNDSSGVIRGFVPPLQSCVSGLADNATAAGGWVLPNTSLIGETAHLIDTTANAGTAYDLSYVALDATRDLLVWSYTGTNLGVYGAIYDKSAKAWGSITLIRATAGAAKAVKTATDQVLVVSCSSTTAFEAVTLTTSGTTITPNTAATATLGGNIITMNDLVVFGSSFVVSYTRATTTGGVRAMTISGTTVTIGSEAVTTNEPITSGVGGKLYAVDASVILRIGTYATPFTISGSSATAGTGALLNSTTTTPYFKVQAWGDRWLAVKQSGTLTNAVVITVSGTTATISQVTVTSSLCTSVDIVQISSTKVAFVGVLASTALINAVLSRSAGTLTVGASSDTGIGAYSEVAALGFSGTDARFYVRGSTNDVLYELDCSSTTAVSYATYLAQSSGYFANSDDKDAALGPFNLAVGSGVFGTKGAAGSGLLWHSGASVSAARAPSLAGNGSIAGVKAWRGATTKEAFVTTKANGSRGAIVKLEAAQP